MRLTGLVAVLCIIAGAPSALAQQTVDLASISGRVADQTGAVVSDAQVTARQTQTNETTATTTDQEGRFRLPYLRVGKCIPRNSGEGSDYLNLNVRLSRTFHLRNRVQLEGLEPGCRVDPRPPRDASVFTHRAW